MKNLFEQYSTLVITLSTAVIISVVLFHLLFFVLLPSAGQSFDSSQLIMPPLISGQASEPMLVQNEYIRWIVVVAVVLMVVLLGVIAFSLYGHHRTQQLNRDGQRKADLERIKRAFMAYREVHGYFPLSSTYQPEYYTGINLSKDWNYYGLPTAEQMTRFLPDWPVSDPKIDYHSNQQFNQYLYYPREQGQAFDLYAHLELPESPVQDYNAIDNLLRSWGNYNYKISSTSETIPVAPPVVEQNHQLTQEREMRQQLLAQPETVDVQEVNAEINFLADEVVASPKPELPEMITNQTAAVVSPVEQSGQQIDALNQAVATKLSLNNGDELSSVPPISQVQPTSPTPPNSPTSPTSPTPSTPSDSSVEGLPSILPEEGQS